MRGSNRTCHRGRIAVLYSLLCGLVIGLVGRLFSLVIFRSEHYSQMAEDLHEGERTIEAARGSITDVSGTAIATNRAIRTISVIHDQMKDPETVIGALVDELGVSEERVRKKVEKRSSREIVKTNMDKEEEDKIRSYVMEGVKVDKNCKRYYPYDGLASKVLGFTGGDSQGIIGLKVMYKGYLKGTNGTILTTTDAAGIETKNTFEDRVEPVAGNDLYISLDVNIQKYAEQVACQAMERKGAERVSVIVMNPQNGEMMAMVNVPEFNLNDPFTLNVEPEGSLTAKERRDLLNQIWRNPRINDTYEPGSTFKIITAAAGLKNNVVGLKDHFSCPDFRIVEDRKIRCHKVDGRGSETSLQGAMNSCSLVSIDVGQRLGVKYLHYYFEQFGLLGKTGIDLPGEAVAIMHKKENMGLVGLATMFFGQSFQITSLQLITTASSVVNGENRVTPYFGMKTVSADGEMVRELEYPIHIGAVSAETSEAMYYILEHVAAGDSGEKAALDDYRINGETTTSEKLSKSLKRYISSFIGFAPANDPQVIALITIDEPAGTYYGGTTAAPVVSDIFKDIPPYLGIEVTEEETASAIRIYG